MAELHSPALLQRYPFVERESLLVTRPWLQWLQLLGTTLLPFMEGSDTADLLAALTGGTAGVTQQTEALSSALLGVQARPERLARLEAAVAELEGALMALSSRPAPVAPAAPVLDALTMQALLMAARRPPTVQPGTALSLVRYSATGQVLESAPLTVASDTKVALGTTSPEAAVRTTLSAPLNEVPAMVVQQASAVNNQGIGLQLTRRTTGDMVDNFGGILSFAVADNAAVDNELVRLVCARQGADNSGRFRVRTANAGVFGAASTPGELAVDPLGNVSLSADVFTHGGSRVLALGQGTAPATGPADAVQLWSANRGGTAGKNSLHVRTEDGTSHVLGDLSGIGTTTPLFPLHVPGRVAQGVPSTAPTDADLGNNQMSVWVNGSTLTFRVRDTAGVLKNATLALA